jgi:hypothetical protein
MIYDVRKTTEPTGGGEIWYVCIGKGPFIGTVVSGPWSTQEAANVALDKLKPEGAAAVTDTKG